MRRMTRPVAIVDLFSGPGGLAEGFSECRGPDGQRLYRIAFSIERDPWAYRTLRLRTFLRTFQGNLPPQYYDFLNGFVASEPDWATLYPMQWIRANTETVQRELGEPETTDFLHQKIEQLRQQYAGRTILLGGPPCQTHSIARRNGVPTEGKSMQHEYKSKNLYKEFVRALSHLRPAIAVMENVTGMLTSTLDGNRIIQQVMNDLRNPDNDLTYRLLALSKPPQRAVFSEDLVPRDFIVRAEDHGIPQARHRLIIVCLRSDIADSLPDSLIPCLEKEGRKVVVDDVIALMPALRSGLSRNDNCSNWKTAIHRACEIVLQNQPSISSELLSEFRTLISSVQQFTNSSKSTLTRSANGGLTLPTSCPSALSQWIFDHRLARLPNNETRGHMPTDLARYLFSAAYGATVDRSPRTTDFPQALVPDHRSWKSGSFADRYRVQLRSHPCSTVTSHISKDGHHFIHPDPRQCRSLTVREVARIQTFPDNYFFMGGRTQQYIQVGNAVPPFLALQIARSLWPIIEHSDRMCYRAETRRVKHSARKLPQESMTTAGLS